MKCKLPNQDTTTARLYIGDVMGSAYDPPGVEVHESDDGIRYIRVQSAIGEDLVDAYGFEEIEEDTPDSGDTNDSEDEA